MVFAPLENIYEILQVEKNLWNMRSDSPFSNVILLAVRLNKPAACLQVQCIIYFNWLVVSNTRWGWAVTSTGARRKLGSIDYSSREYTRCTRRITKNAAQLIYPYPIQTLMLPSQRQTFVGKTAMATQVEGNRLKPKGWPEGRAKIAARLGPARRCAGTALCPWAGQAPPERS